jgi:hypothetical protein
VFGYPTGVGCLIARAKRWVAAASPHGSIYMASVVGDWHAMAPNEARFEDGTLAFLQIPDLEAGLSGSDGIGIDLIHQRVMPDRLASRLQLAALRHGNGEPMARIYGPPAPATAAAPSPSTCWIPAAASSTSAPSHGLPQMPGSRSAPGASAIPAQARARSSSPGQTGAGRCGDPPARRISTSASSACPAAGRSAHRWAWPPTSMTWSGSWPSSR